MMAIMKFSTLKGGQIVQIGPVVILMELNIEGSNTTFSSILLVNNSTNLFTINGVA